MTPFVRALTFLAPALCSALLGPLCGVVWAAEAPSASHEVKVRIELGGEILPKGSSESGVEPDTEDKSEGGRIPVRVDARLEFIQSPIAESDSQRLREYRVAEATIHAGREERRSGLRGGRRVVNAFASEGFPPVLAAHGGPLTRDEIDLLRVAADPLTLASLAPGPLATEGDSWDVDRVAIAPLLLLEAVSLCEVRATVDELTTSHAKLRVAGAAHGLVDGAQTEFDLRGVALYDRRSQRFERFNLAYTQQRAAGPATPGLDVTCKVNVTVSPTAQTVEAPADTPTLMLMLAEPSGGWTLEHAREWFAVAQDPEATTLRLVEGQEVLAQTTIVQRPPRQADKQPVLEEFEQDVRSMLGDRLERITSTAQRNTACGLRAIEVNAEGAAPTGEPVRWRCTLVLPNSYGPAVSLTTTVEGRLTERVGEADRELADALRITPAEVATRSAGTR